jgi:cytochrome c-type biogenesis protein CcmE
MTTTAPIPPPTPGSVQVRRKVKARYVVAALVCAAVVAWLLVVGLAKNIVYLRPVSYAVTHRAQQGTRPFRMAGQVEPDSIHATANGVRFVMTDGTVFAPVNLQGSPPALFKDCAPVVVEGKWAGITFMGERLLIRHGASYSPSKKDAAAQLAAEKKNKKCPAVATS